MYKKTSKRRTLLKQVILSIARHSIWRPYCCHVTSSCARQLAGAEQLSAEPRTTALESLRVLFYRLGPHTSHAPDCKPLPLPRCFHAALVSMQVSRNPRRQHRSPVQHHAGRAAQLTQRGIPRPAHWWAHAGASSSRLMKSGLQGNPAACLTSGVGSARQARPCKAPSSAALAPAPLSPIHKAHSASPPSELPRPGADSTPVGPSLL